MDSLSRFDLTDSDLRGTVYAAILFGGYLALWTVKRYRQRRVTGEDPEVFGEATDRLQQYFARVTKVLTGAVVLLLIVHAVGPNDVWGFRRLTPLDAPWVDHLGLAVGLGGLVLCYVAQTTMGTSWRVGIDEENRTPLVTTGIFGYVRNPTYLGLFLVNAGFWLIWPTCTVATFGLLFGFFLETQVRCEEQHLLTDHGDAYQRYLTRTKRYFPGVY